MNGSEQRILITKKQLAEKLQVSVQTISAYGRQGMPVALRLGNRWPRYEYQECIWWLEQKSKEGRK